MTVEDPFDKPSTFHHLEGEVATTIVKSCTRLISCPLDPDILHSTLRLCLRLTRSPGQASVFAKEGGAQALLSLTQRSGFRGFASLVTLLFKHCLEDGLVLRQAMEGVIRASVASPFYNSKEVRPQAMGGRELYYVMRKLGPCACRNPQLFMELAPSIIRLCSEPPTPAVYTSTQRAPTTLLKCVPLTKVEHGPLNAVQSDLVNLLIDYLCAEDPFESDAKENAEDKNAESAKIEEEGEIPRVMHFGESGGRRGRVRHGSYRRQLTAGTYDDDDVNSEDMTVDAEETGGSRMASLLGAATVNSSPTGERDSANNGNKTEDTHNQPLMSKAAILRLLSELVETYPACARLIAESSRKVKVHGKPAKDMTVLAFVFDHLLPVSSTSSGKLPPIAKLSRIFVQCLAVSHPSPEIIALLVTEFKHALVRALSLPESSSKHNRIRALTGLLSQISDYITAARGALNPSHFARLLIRKGFISDLARSIHSLNLSSPMLPGTINSILKPLEVLTKIVNQVAAAGKKSEGEKSSTAATTPAAVPSAATANVISDGETVATVSAPSDVTVTVNTVPAASTASSEGVVTSSASEHATVTQETPTVADGQCIVIVRGYNVICTRCLVLSSLEATHESLIPLEEEEEEAEGAAAMDLEERTNLLDQVVTLARDLGRSHRLRGMYVCMYVCMLYVWTLVYSNKDTSRFVLYGELVLFQR